METNLLLWSKITSGENGISILEENGTTREELDSLLYTIGSDTCNLPLNYQGYLGSITLLISVNVCNPP